MHDAAQALEEGRAPGQEIERALEATDKLNVLFDAVLRLSRIQASKLRSEAIDLAAVAQKAADFLSPVAEAHDQVILVSGAAAFVEADRVMVEQALVNLVQNACTHAGDGTRIEIVVDANRVEVRDYGKGVAEADLEHMRAPFHRGEDARTSPGHGLGLAIVQAIADAHHAAFVLERGNPGLSAKLMFPNFKKS